MNRRLRVVVRGAVQGVGFRPFVYRLAGELDLPGWVLNDPQGVYLEVEGPPPALEAFLLRLQAGPPPPAFIQSLEYTQLDPVGYAGFEIRASRRDGPVRALVLPDIATCPACLAEVLDPADRRHLYPFTNCTHCGPRFSIIEALPYDRPRTSMKGFALCPACRAEYENPLDRRFHAQPTACPECGPRLALWDAEGHPLAERHDALLGAVAALRRGDVVAVKGLGGFHLMVRADDDAAVRRLRERKRREAKPLALMAPSLKRAQELCHLDPLEERLLTAPEAPIVLLRRLAEGGGVAPAVAPGHPNLGVMLPCTPLHHLLLRELGDCVVATSGNRSEEPICIDEREAVTRLAGIADLYLVHDRPIVRHVDDSVARVVLGREQLLRRARGYAPLPITLKREMPTILATGAQLKNALALAVGRDVFVSQHIGDLENPEAVAALTAAAQDFRRLYDVTPEIVAVDAHPDYASTRLGRALGLPVVAVQHHMAHVAACMAENELEPPLLGVAWDGTGDGEDGTIWGGEFLVPEGRAFTRVAHLRPFRLPGGEAAVREPRRSALGLLHAAYGAAAAGPAFAGLPPYGSFSAAARGVLWRMLERGINAPVTTSVGRLFDAVAALLDVRQVARYEGEAAIELEFAAARARPLGEPWPFTLRPVAAAGPLVLDWQPLLEALLAERAAGADVPALAGRFHATLAEMIVAVAERVGLKRVALGGGCFQNRVLLEETVRRLTARGFRAYWPQRVPPNDGGIALGQVAVAARRAERVDAHVSRGSR